MIDAIGFVETACAALESNDKIAFAMPRDVLERRNRKVAS